MTKHRIIFVMVDMLVGEYMVGGGAWSTEIRQNGHHEVDTVQVRHQRSHP